MLRFWRLLAGGLVLVVTACSGDSGAATTVATTQPSTTTTTTQPLTTTVPALAPPSEPGAVIEYLYDVWLDDRGAALAVFAEDAVITNIPSTPATPTTREGVGSIDVWLAQESGLHESLEITEIEVDGDTVIWDDLACTVFDCWTATGNVAVIKDGKIVTWDFGQVSKA